MIPKKMSLCMQKVVFKYIIVDERFHKIGIHVVLACNYCSDQKIESLDHVLNIGLVASSVQEEVALSLGVFNMEAEH